ncbi:heme-binding protein 2-like [Gastrophryne carolinensis]
MEARTLLLLTLLLAVLGASQAGNEKPSFCGNNDCPVYQVVKKYENFEHRMYEESRWVTTPMEQDYFGFEMVKSFRRLFKYITGNNAEGLKINMTVPVLIYVPGKQSPDDNSTMSFFVPPELQNPPQPLDPNVYLESSPRVSFFVKSFGGYALEYQYSKQASRLAEELHTLGLAFDDTFFIRAGYNDPFTLINRHNEVWYRTK